MPPVSSSTDHLPPHQPAARQRPKSPDRVLAEAEAQWLFSEQELMHTPSVQDGMAPEKEKDIRAKGINFIRQVGIMLKLPELTLSTAAIFFNRFLMRVSLVDRPNQKALHHYTLGATALFLATKVEESCRKMKDLVVACCRVAQKNPNLLIDEQSKDFWKWRDTILLNEDVLLEMLCFDLTIEPPHKQLYEMLKYYQVHHNKQLRNAAWAFVTDSNITQLCLLCSSHTIAAAALYSAARYCGVSFPDSFDGRPWWHVQHVSLDHVLKACNYMAANYEHVPIKPGHEGAQTIYVRFDGQDSDSDWDATRLSSKQAITSPSAPALHQDAAALHITKTHQLDLPPDDRAVKKRRTSESGTATSIHAHASRTVESHGSEEGEVEG
ncbi:cyclin-like protein [Aureobasidium subglaciale]|nr:cyclin-like protein [Aureobasidium subglaciale]